MQEKHVSTWWGEGRSWPFKDIEEKYNTYALGYKIDQGEKKKLSAFIIECEKRPIGYIQKYNALDFTRDDFDPNELWTDQSGSVGSIDFYVGEPDCLRMGLGAEILQNFLSSHVFHFFDACLVDPDKRNKIAIRAYAKAGFTTFEEMENCVVMIARKKTAFARALKHKIYFIIGASGSGKTTTLKCFKRAIPQNCTLIHFDSIGVPPFEEMEKEYGSIEEWQRIKTIAWVKKIVEENLSSSNVIFDAQIRPSFIKEACDLHGVDYEIVLFDCSDAERKKRLISRGHPELADENMMNWAAFLRKECEKHHHKIINNSHITIDQTLQLFCEWL